MGLFDNMGSFVRRGTDAAGRAAETANLKMQLNDLMKRRQGLAAQLGASLYEPTKEIQEFRAGREQIYDSIEAIDRQRAALERQLADIEAASQAAQMATVRYTCPRCGSSVYAQDSFCSGCGLPIADVKAMILNAAPQQAPNSGMACPSCGAPINEGDVFCMSCGKALSATDVPPAQEMIQDTATNSGYLEQEDETVYDPNTAITVPAQKSVVEEAASIDAMPDGGFCPNCGNPVEAGQAFCGVCGSKI